MRSHSSLTTIQPSLPVTFLKGMAKSHSLARGSFLWLANMTNLEVSMSVAPLPTFIYVKLAMIVFLYPESRVFSFIIMLGILHCVGTRMPYIDGESWIRQGDVESVIDDGITLPTLQFSLASFDVHHSFVLS
jgi:hypothetical protein